MPPWPSTASTRQRPSSTRPRRGSPVPGGLSTGGVLFIVCRAGLRASAIASSDIEIRSPVDSSMSSSRRGGWSETLRARAMSWSVVRPIADTTTTTRLPLSRVAATRPATALSRSGRPPTTRRTSAPRSAPCGRLCTKRAARASPQRAAWRPWRARRADGIHFAPQRTLPPPRRGDRQGAGEQLRVRLGERGSSRSGTTPSDAGDRHRDVRAWRRSSSYPARDGTKIPMFVRRPSGCASAPRRARARWSSHFHGGPEGQTRAGLQRRARRCSSTPASSYVEPNVRGSDGYGKAWLHADDGAKRLEVITDIEDARSTCARTGRAGGKAPKIGIFGGSYGGYSTLMGMTMFAGAYDAGRVGGRHVATSSPSSRTPRRTAASCASASTATRRRTSRRSHKLSPITYVDQVKAPLLHHPGRERSARPGRRGDADPRGARRRRASPRELIVFADEGHGVARSATTRCSQLGHTIALLPEAPPGHPEGLDAVGRGGSQRLAALGVGAVVRRKSWLLSWVSLPSGRRPMVERAGGWGRGRSR